MKHSIVFDLDGTLITCENKQKFVLYSILNAMTGIENEKLNLWWELKRNGFNTEKALNELKIPNSKLIADNWKNSIENFSWCMLDRPFEDSRSTLKDLKEKYYFRIIILSARSSSFQAAQSVSRFGFIEYIDDLIVVNNNDVIKAKALNLRNIQPLIYLGDSELDYYAANDSKISFVALSRGQRSIDYLKKLGAIRIEDNLEFLGNDDIITQIKTGNRSDKLNMSTND